MSKYFNDDTEVSAMYTLIDLVTKDKGVAGFHDFPQSPKETMTLKVAFARVFFKDNLLTHKSRITTVCGKCGKRTSRMVKHIDATCKSCNEQLGFYPSPADKGFSRYSDSFAKEVILAKYNYTSEQILAEEQAEVAATLEALYAEQAKQHARRGRRSRPKRPKLPKTVVPFIEEEKDKAGNKKVDFFIAGL